MRRNFLLGCFSLLLVWPALATELGGVKLDERTSLGGKELLLNGAGIRTKLVFKVYVASLYVPAKVTDLAGVLAAQPRRMQLNLLRDLSADDLAAALVDGIRDTSSTEQAAAIKSQTDQLLSIMKSIGQAKSGDVVTMDFVGGETRVAFNGQSKGAIGGEPLNAALMRIWMADKPVQADLRKALLGG